MSGTAGNMSRVDLLLGRFMGDPEHKDQMRFIVCLQCGHYVPEKWSDLDKWKQQHEWNCGISAGYNRVTPPHFYVTTDPEMLSKPTFPLVPDLTEMEMLALVSLGDE